MLTRISAKGIEIKEVPPGLIPRSGVVSRERPPGAHSRIFGIEIERETCVSQKASEGRSYIVSFNTFIERRKKMKAMRAVKRVLRDENGTETLEWAIIIGIIAVGAIGFIALIGPWVTQKFSDLWDAMDATSGS